MRSIFWEPQLGQVIGMSGYCIGMNLNNLVKLYREMIN